MHCTIAINVTIENDIVDVVTHTNRVIALVNHRLTQGLPKRKSYYISSTVSCELQSQYPRHIECKLHTFI